METFNDSEFALHSQVDIVERAQELFDLLEVPGGHKVYETFLTDTSAAMKAYTSVTTASCSCQNPFSFIYHRKRERANCGRIKF